MKKTFKKMLSIVLALTMVLAMGLTAFAGETGNEDDNTPETEATQTYTITASAVGENGVSHTYEIYQIFTGELSDGKLVNLAWGANAKDTTAAIKDATDALEDVIDKTDEEKLAVISQYVTLDTNAFKTVASGNTVTGIPSGYYLIKDKKNSLEGKHDAYTLYVVKVLDKNLTIQPKNEYPSVDKLVHDETGDAEAGALDGWGESADHAINESFQFKLVATIPADVKLPLYDTYKTVFTDTMSTGVTFESIESVKVNAHDATYECTATDKQAGGSWTLTINDIKPLLSADEQKANVTITVIYNAHLNENAVLHNANATDDAANNNKVELEYSNNPNADATGSETGKTPEDYVFVFSYKVNNTKTDENGEALPDAGFQILDSNNTAIGMIYDADKNAYRPIEEGETAVDNLMSQDDGTFNIIGLDAGTYTLKETVVPDGYNKADDVTIEISATHIENASKKGANLTLTKEIADNTIVDESGATLPETGGIGTTLFYVFGAILVLGAGVVLVSRRRMEA